MDKTISPLMQMKAIQFDLQHGEEGQNGVVVGDWIIFADGACRAVHPNNSRDFNEPPADREELAELLEERETQLRLLQAQIQARNYKVIGETLDARHGLPTVQVDRSWYLYPDGTRMQLEASSVPIVRENYPNEYERFQQIVLYWETRYKLTCEKFDSLKTRLVNDPNGYTNPGSLKQLTALQDDAQQSYEVLEWARTQLVKHDPNKPAAGPSPEELAATEQARNDFITQVNAIRV